MLHYMKLSFNFFVFTLLILTHATAQNTNLKNANKDMAPPYREIPSYPETYTPGTVAARMVDALGFRYDWATEGLRDEDLQFRPNDMARSSMETIDHIYQLSELIVNAPDKKINEPGVDEGPLTFEQKRIKTLQNLKKASDLLKATGGEGVDSFKMIYKNGEKTTEFPFWNLINGPIADAIWHVGQIVSFRRSSGNPFNSKVSVFLGKLKE